MVKMQHRLYFQSFLSHDVKYVIMSENYRLAYISVEYYKRRNEAIVSISLVVDIYKVSSNMKKISKHSQIYKQLIKCFDIDFNDFSQFVESSSPIRGSIVFDNKAKKWLNEKYDNIYLNDAGVLQTIFTKRKLFDISTISNTKIIISKSISGRCLPSTLRHFNPKTGRID